MENENNKKVVCDNCEFLVNDDDDFCINCGGLFVDDVKCETHPVKDAIGVCAVCHVPICKLCAGRISGYYLCGTHSNYEIYQGMARIYGTSDFALSEFILDALKKEGFHAFNYSRKTSPISMGGVDYSLYRASGEFDGHLINEIKIMIPLSEVLEAESVLQNFKIAE